MFVKLSHQTIRLGLPIALFLSAALDVDVRADQMGDDGDILALIDGMEQSWALVSDYVKVVEKTERLLDGAVTHQVVLIKFRKPDRYYMRVLEGRKYGAELIYPKSDQERVAVAHAGGFTGKFSRFLKKTVVLRGVVPSEFSLEDPAIVSGQHQTVVDSGLGSTIDRIATNIRAAATLGEGRMSLAKECSERDVCRFRIDVELPATAGQYHEVKDGESLWTIADHFNCPMYVIWYNNPGMNKPTDLATGQRVFIPRYYAARGRIWIWADTLKLSELEIFDKHGKLYEHYVYRSIETNVGLTNIEFDTENPEYRF